MSKSSQASLVAGDRRPAELLTFAAVLIYIGAIALGWPQRATKQMVSARQHHRPVASSIVADAESELEAEFRQLTPQPPPVWMVTPFVCMLAAIAMLPLLPVLSPWWEKNRNRLLVALLLATLTLIYYLGLHPHPIERHFLGHSLVIPAPEGLSWRIAAAVLQNAIFNEYIPFIVLLFSLYVITGGIRVEGDLRAHPLTNSIFLTCGGMLASIIGTTGAAMLLIRPLLETNRERRHVAHTVVFFIFVVCNCGGCLTPLGDPPLFLGYLQGVDFLWTMNLWRPWLFVNGALIGTYFLWDHFFAYRREAASDIALDEELGGRLRIGGLALQVPLLLLLILSVALLDPAKPFPGTHWHPWLYLREAAQLALSGVSLALGSRDLRVANNFNFDAIMEVAVLFLGIFVCMQPALQILDARGAELGINTADKFFWASGVLSSVLDNAPTYLVFFEVARSLSSMEVVTMAGVPEPFLVAISLGAVFMGAMTYIGNGPNFMVKAVAESAGVRMPSFFGYLAYSCFVLLPILVVTTWLFI